MVSIVSPGDQKIVEEAFTLRLSFSRSYDKNHSLKVYYNNAEAFSHPLTNNIRIKSMPFTDRTVVLVTVAVVKGDAIVATSEGVRLLYRTTSSKNANTPPPAVINSGSTMRLTDDDQTSKLRFVRNA